MSTHVYEIEAFNYAHDSENRIHDDAVAARYGFEGGLVPGASDYAYLARAVYAGWGDEWLRTGGMWAKFIKPVYHGEVARAEARVGEDPDRLSLALIDPRGVTCAVGEAWRHQGETPPRIEDFPAGELPAESARPAATVATFAPGHILGEVCFEHQATSSEEETRALFVEVLTDSGGRYVWDPALCTHFGNQIVRANVQLGAWIHTASHVHYFAAPEEGDRLVLRGRVADTYEKRGHVMTECDLALFANAQRPLVSMRHTAIIRLAGDE